jgi:hypothetical protein
VTFEIRIHGNVIAHKVAEQYGIPKIHNVQQAMASPYWPLIREGMEAEILTSQLLTSPARVSV